MKKIFLLLIVLISGNLISQININTTTYTVPQLVNDILINRPCVTANNIIWRTGTNFGSSNGIGYFTNSNPNFPISSGVILSTGDVNQAVGPNTTEQSNGNPAWIGDLGLESTLAASGIIMTSTNASVLEFEFVPDSPNFSFKFLFASEEYGNSQCQFSDAFAFLLTNLTAATPTVNLAKVPGTTTPISVVTVRDNAYNSSCPSVNANYFGTFNGGSNAINALNNFNGQTKLITTDAVTLVPGDTYKIKLVIADRANSGFDSAIFLSADSFGSIVEVLGPDITLSSNTAICDGQSTVLNTNLLATDYTFVWQNGSTVIPAQTGPTLTVTAPGTYTVVCTNIATPCKVITDPIIVEYRAPLVTPNPKTIYRCNTGQPTYSYDLSYNTPFVTNGQPVGTTVSYHATLADANANVGFLPLTYTSAPNTTVFVRINNPTTGCFKVKSFDLKTSPAPVANTVAPMNSCALPTNPTKARFNLAGIATPQVLLLQLPAEYQVKYFANLANANGGTPAIATNYTTVSTTVYARIYSISDPNCYAVTPVQLIVDPIPAVSTLLDVTTCNSYALPTITDGNYYDAPNGPLGTGMPLFAGNFITDTKTIYIYSQGSTPAACSSQTSFKVTIVKVADLTIASGTYCNSYTLPSLTNGEYRTATAGGGTIINPGSNITTSQTVHYYYSSLLPTPCTVEASFLINITVTQAVVTLPNVFECTSYVLPTLSFGKYYPLPNGAGVEITAGTAITSSQTVYIHGVSGTCPSDSSFKVIIGTSTFPTSTTACANYYLPALAIGNYYSQANGAGVMLNPATPINTQGINTIWVYVPTTTFPNCTANYSFTVTITLPALVAPVLPYPICNTYTLPAPSAGHYFTDSHVTSPTGGTQLSDTETLTDSGGPQKIWLYVNNGSGCESEISFDVLVSKTPLVDNRGNVEGCNSYPLTPLVNGKYYSGSGGVGEYAAGSSITTVGANTVYIYANNNGCTAENSFVVTIFNVLVTQPLPVEECDSYTLPPLTGTQKYFTLTGGTTVAGNVQRLPGYVVTTTQTLYIYDESPTRNWCFDEKQLSITIHNTPVLANVSNIYRCDSYTLPTLAVGKYYTAPHNLIDGSGGGTEITTLTLTTSQPIYVYAESGTSPKNCRVEKTFNVNIYNVDEIPDPAAVCVNDPYILPPLSVGSYFTSSGAPKNAGDVINTSQTIFVRGTGGPLYANCVDQTDIVISVFQNPIINTVPTTLTTICDEDGINDGVTNFDLTTLTTTILGTQLPADFSITYFANQPDADNNVNPITTTTDTTAFVRITNILGVTCFKVGQINLIVNRIPEPTPQNNQFVCINSLTNTVIMPLTLNSGLNATTHTFEWFNSSTVTPIGTASTLLVIAPDTYSIIATNIATGCKSEKISVVVDRSESPTVSFTVNEDFSQAPVLTINATGVGGDYEYQLDNGPFQDSPTFYNAVSGVHEITVRDKNGCGESTVEITVINYQRFFTPNGDGSNDIWNISDLLDNSASITIYDRFGKFLTRITPSDRGWDGSFNGELLPADDYWFIAKYRKGTQNIEYKSHFSLKR